MDGPCETDNDTDEDIDVLPDQFGGFKKRFLLRKPPDRREPERPTKPTRTQNAPETQAKRTQSDDILQDIQYLKNIYGQAPGEDARPIPYAEAAKLFQKVETWARQVHTPRLYKMIHKIHHLYSAPFGLAAEYTSPIEVMILGFGTVGCPILWCALNG